MVYIDKVHYSIDAHGCDVVASVKWTNSLTEDAFKECTKQEMINFILKNPNVTKTKYYRNNTWVIGEDVRVVAGKFLRTDSNSTPSDNLSSLPRY